jgi:hypothetical protein
VKEYDFGFLRRVVMDEFRMYDAVLDFWETGDKRAAIKVLQFFATNWRPFW